MKTSLFALAIAILMIPLSSQVHAQAFVNDNDGLLDVGEAPGFPTDPMAAIGTLDLRFQSIQDLDGTSLLTNLGMLWLLYNEIASIEAGDFDGLNDLHFLILSDNQITSIESGAFNGLTNLQSLGLSSNQITSIDRAYFEGLSNLQSLILDANRITSIEVEDFEGLANLQVLGLEANRITNIESGAFNGLTNLRTLSLRANPITRIEDLPLLLGLENLAHLIIDDGLFSLYASEFTAWDALPGKRLTVLVPEPTAFCLALVGVGILSGLSSRPERLTVRLSSERNAS